MLAARRVKNLFPRCRNSEPFVRVNFSADVVLDRDELHLIDEHYLFQFIRHPEFVSVIQRFERTSRDADELIWVGVIVYTRAFPVAHFAATHEISYELEIFAIPGVKIWARGRFAIKFLDT